MKRIFTLLIIAFAFKAFAQSPSIGIPDSVKNISFPGSTGQYTISNPLVYSGTAFTNPPVTISCIMNCKSDYLYFYDLNLNVPAAATITGVKVIHTRGGCNSGAYMTDTLQLAYNGATISGVKSDVANPSATDTLGSSSDNWGAALTPAIVNSNSFGIFLHGTGNGICTFAQSSVTIKVYYTICVTSNLSGIPDSVKNVSFPGSTGQYNIASSNPLLYSGSAFTNAPIATSCILNCKSDYLYFYDLNMGIPVTATITGVQITHGRGGCNSGAFMIDTLHLAYNGAIISSAKRDSASNFTTTILGSSTDSWGTTLTPAIVNSNSFGVFINGTGSGICTFSQSNVVIDVYYCTSLAGINSYTQKATIKIFPNPVNDFLNIEVGIENIGNTYAIYDYTGKLISTGKITNELTQLNTNILSSGMYFLKINGEIPQTIKFIKK